MPGVLHYLQSEWGKHERDRAHWDADKASLKVPTSHHITSPTSHHPQARIAFLEGERTGQEQLKRDLLRRVKMLEYALQCERHVITTSHHTTSHHTIAQRQAQWELCARAAAHRLGRPAVHGYITPHHVTNHHTTHHTQPI